MPKIVFPVADLAEATAFYERLGFIVEMYDSSYAWVAHRGTEILHLSLDSELDKAVNPTSGYLHVRDVDRWHESWSDAGMNPSATEDRPWGMREFSLRDPSGNLLRVGANLPG